MYAVVACPRCRRSRVVEAGKRTTQCGSCGRPLELTQTRAYWSGESLDEARHAAGLVNAKLAHREEEFAAALLPQAPPRPRHDDPFAAAAAAARAARSEKDRVDRLARALAAALGEATRGDLARGFHAAGLPVAKLDEHLERMLVTAVLFEPRPGRYKAF